MGKLLRKWFVHWHGEGEPYQSDLYRCQGCHHLVTWKMIRSSGCKCGSIRMNPTNPRPLEILKVMVTPWLVK